MLRKHWSDSATSLTGLLFAVLPGSLVLGGCEPNNRGYRPEQPLVYSHAVHAGAMKIPCQYCHFAAERSRYAGIPPLEVCMNCHKQATKDHPEVKKTKALLEAAEPVEWVKVHRLPDHVYFSHAAHMRTAPKTGITCQDCHGPVESMGVVRQWSTLAMGWCIDCHRQNTTPGPGNPKDEQIRGGPLTDCGVCHH